MARVVAAALLSAIMILACAPMRIAPPPPPPRVECGPLDPATCEDAVVSILATIADPPSAPIAVTVEEGSYCVDHLFDGVACPPRPMPPGAVWIGRAEVIFGGRYESGFVHVLVGSAGIDANLVAIERRPQAPPTD